MTGSELRQLRDRRGVSLRYIADICNCNEDWLRHVELHDKEVPPHVEARLIKEYGLQKTNGRALWKGVRTSSGVRFGAEGPR